MKQKLQRSMNLLILIAMIVGTVVPTFGAGQRRRRPRKPVVYYTVPANTVIRVRLDEQLTSKTARVGDRFSSTVTEPVYGGSGVEVIPVGSKIWGRVTFVKHAERRSPGSIDVSFTSVKLPNGRIAAINGSLSSLQTDDVNADNEGTVKGKDNKKRNVAFIGGGAAGGAIIGAIAGGGKGAAIGALIGGGLGTAGRVFEKEKEAEVKSGTEFGVILNQSIRLPASTVRPA